MRYFILLFCLVITGIFSQSALHAQSCTYQLDLFDAAEDGWTGGLLTLAIGDSTYNVTLDGVNDDGIDSTIFLTVNNGDTIKISWTPGSFNQDVSFVLYNSTNDTVYNASIPFAGFLFEGIVFCPACAEPANVFFENVWDTRARIRWNAGISSEFAEGWWVVYGPPGFDLQGGEGDTVFTGLPRITLTNLEKKTDYEVYIIQDCTNDTYSLANGPYAFQTLWTTDVGISGLLSPVSGCDLGVETLRIQLANYGSAPQSLIPFNFSVNGAPSGVPQPQDGFFTGVLGKDSIEVIDFETLFNFSQPGEYEILIWTELEGDQDSLNDTLRIFINNRLIAPYFQNFENWDGGWTVDTASLFSTWEFGTPLKLGISGAANGIKAWATSLTGQADVAEFSFLVSPCFDFSNLTSDPVIQFSLYYETNDFFDASWLEASVDGGNSWEKVGAVDEGLNWYNTNNTWMAHGDVWAGSSGGWITARHRLFGVAGESEVRLRFVYAAGNFFFNSDGMAIDDISIKVPFQKDITSLSVTTNGDDEECGLALDRVRVTVSNFGTQSQSQFPLYYSVNGGTPVMQNFNGGLLTPDEVSTFTFSSTFDSRDSLINILVWTGLSGDQDLSNDTVSYSVDHRANPLPFAENFEAGAIPADWTVSNNAFVSNGHGAPSFVISSNLFFGSQNFEYELPRFGLVSEGDSLRFDYRLVDFDDENTGFDFSNTANSINVAISTNCGQSYQTIFTIDSANHIPSVELRTIALDLSAFAGNSIRIRFTGNWGTLGDYWVDIDNINLGSCFIDLNLSGNTTPSTSGNNGTASVNVGMGGGTYSYKWNTGATSQTITGLPPGPVTVTVSDNTGCFDVLTLNIGTSGTENIDGLTKFALMPNPTNGITTLLVELRDAATIQAEVFNLLGQPVWQNNADETQTLNTTIDLTDLPAGIYMVRLQINQQIAVKRLVKQ